MKAIMISIQPKWVAKILNGEKTIEIRKRFPKDYRGWVYIYCTKGKETLAINPYGGYALVPNKYKNEYFNGKVVARFYCDNVEKIYNYGDLLFDTNSLKSYELLKQSCLTKEELHSYLQGKTGYAIHISQLEIFDEPKEVSEIRSGSCKYCNYKNTKLCKDCHIAKAPQSWCYVEVEE